MITLNFKNFFIDNIWKIKLIFMNKILMFNCILILQYRTQKPTNIVQCFLKNGT